MYVCLDTAYTAWEIAERAKEKGLAVIPKPQEEKVPEKGATVMLNCANVAVEDYEMAMELLRECL